MRFRTVVEPGAGSATGLLVPDDVVEALGSAKRPAVVVTVGSYTYRSTVARMGGRYLVPLSAQHRSAAGVAAGDEVDVTLELDAAERVVEMPVDLAAALEVAGARAFFDSLAPSHRTEWVRWIEEAKRADTRAARIDKAATALAHGRRTR